MKRYLWLLAVLLLCSTTSRATWSPSTLTADGAFHDTPTVVHGVLITGDGTNNCTLQLYDNSAGSGTVLGPALTTTSTVNTFGWVGFDWTAVIAVYGDFTIAGGGTCTATIAWGP